jgi:hypothetical protein
MSRDTYHTRKHKYEGNNDVADPVHALNPRQQWTGTAIVPSDEKNSPAEGEELDPFSLDLFWSLRRRRVFGAQARVVVITIAGLGWSHGRATYNRDYIDFRTSCVEHVEFNARTHFFSLGKRSSRRIKNPGSNGPILWIRDTLDSNDGHSS